MEVVGCGSFLLLVPGVRVLVILWTSSYSFMKESVLVADREAEVHMYQSSMLQIPSQHTTGENARQRRRRRPLPPELSIEREEIALELLCKGGVRKHSQHQSDARVELNATRQLSKSGEIGRISPASIIINVPRSIMSIICIPRSHIAVINHTNTKPPEEGVQWMLQIIKNYHIRRSCLPNPCCLYPLQPVCDVNCTTSSALIT